MTRTKETVTLSSLKAPPHNVREHSETQVDALVESVKMFGQIRPVVIDADNTVWAGNGLVQALTKLKRKKVDVLRLKGLSASDKRKLMLADNRVFELGNTDMDGLRAVLGELDDFLNVPGYDASALEMYVASPEQIDSAIGGYGKLPPDSNGNGKADTAEVSRAATTCPRCGAEVWHEAD